MSNCSEEKSPVVRFPDLKQLEEWHVIVSCDQLGETFRVAPTLLINIIDIPRTIALRI